MRIAERVQYAIDDALAGKSLSALMHACFALEGTGNKIFEKSMGSHNVFVETFKLYNWAIEPMFSSGINIEETIFRNVVLKKREAHLSEILYEIFRCNFAHGNELPNGFDIVLTTDINHRCVELSRQSLIMPDTIVYALCSAVVFSRVNQDEHIKDGYYLSLGTMHFDINKWWGREDDAKICFSTVNAPRIVLNLDSLA
ncbi:hypothetical protein [Enterobacter roggenkampii]|uniref:hypothetical protein n=1 Tax=Enterobacter roggenkampii TaxID=1812935 RepID=UPI000B1F3465|nr:hypothetical protein [Enterobacter roggenkampii]